MSGLKAITLRLIVLLLTHARQRRTADASHPSLTPTGMLELYGEMTGQGSGSTMPKVVHNTLGTDEQHHANGESQPKRCRTDPNGSIEDS